MGSNGVCATGDDTTQRRLGSGMNCKLKGKVRSWQWVLYVLILIAGHLADCFPVMLCGAALLVFDKINGASRKARNMRNPDTTQTQGRPETANDGSHRT